MSPLGSPAAATNGDIMQIGRGFIKIVPFWAFPAGEHDDSDGHGRGQCLFILFYCFGLVCCSQSGSDFGKKNKNERIKLSVVFCEGRPLSDKRPT